MIGFGQDRIILMDSTEILSRVLEVNEKNVRYRKYTNLEGPIYSKLKREIDKIIYKNGNEDSFKKDRRDKLEKGTASPEEFKALLSENQGQLGEDGKRYFMLVENMP